MGQREKQTAGRGRPQAESTIGYIQRWRDIVVSERGPALATTRLILLAIAIEMEWAVSDRARIAVGLLAKRGAVSRRTVMNHLRIAVNDGWLERRHPKGFGRAWATYELEILIPWSATLFVAECSDLRSPRREARA